MTRFTIDPAHYTDSEWEELYNASTIMPRTYEARRNAQPFKRPRKYIELAITNVRERAEEVRDIHDDDTWAKDLKTVAERLRELIGFPRYSKKAARKRLYELLTSDIYTDAPEYETRVAEIHALLPTVFGKGGK